MEMNKKGEKKGQVTIFIIIALLIVAIGVLIYMFYPKIFPGVETEAKSPSVFIQECMEEKIQDTVTTISLQGGDYVVDENSGNIYKAKDEEEIRYVRYLCYTNEDFSSCINQEPFLTEHIESEILETINPEIESCFASLVKSYENKGYDVNLKNGTVKVQITPNSVLTDFNRTLSIVKGDESKRYENFGVDLDSSIYDLLEIAKNIIIWEMYVGDSLPESYMEENLNIKVEKKRKEGDVKIYIITDRNTEEAFRFAVRSFAAPVGF